MELHHRRLATAHTLFMGVESSVTPDFEIRCGDGTRRAIDERMKAGVPRGTTLRAPACCRASSAGRGAAWSLDDLVGADEQIGRNTEVKGLRCFEIDRHLEFRRLFNRQIEAAMHRIGTIIIGLLLALVAAAAWGAPITIVAIGASNTSGWGVAVGRAYPEQLQALLRTNGVDANVINAGRSFDTTAGMLRRLNAAVPDGTRVAILQPDKNDLRYFGTHKKRAANIVAMASRLRARNIHVIVFDPVIPAQYYAWDGIHFTAEGHAWIAA